MFTRRDFVKSSAAGLMGLGAMSSLTQLGAGEVASAAPAQPPTPHFIFLRKGNGTFPSFLTPLSLSDADKKKDENNEALDLDLTKLELQDWMAALNPYKQNLTLLQGLSAKMCTMGHATHQSPLALCKAAERHATIARASVDVELGRMFRAPFEHIELSCAYNKKGIVTGLSSIGPGQPNFAFASPIAAFENLFRTGSNDKSVLAEVGLENNTYSFLSDRIKQQGKNLNNIEGTQKIGNYATSIDALTERNKKLQSMAERIRKHAPTLSREAMGESYTTVQQQDAFAEILIGAMGAGLSNSFTLTLDTLDTRLSGIMESDFHPHAIGHNQPIEGVDALEVRKRVRMQHIKVINTIVQGLKKIPEGKGNMFDNTIIMYFPENGEKHHSTGIEEPFIILAGNNTKVNFQGRYIRLPFYGQPGHKTLGNFYTTILNAYGNPIKHFGNLDGGLKMDQTGPIREFMA